MEKINKVFKNGEPLSAEELNGIVRYINELGETIEENQNDWSSQNAVEEMWNSLKEDDDSNRIHNSHSPLSYPLSSINGANLGQPPYSDMAITSDGKGGWQWKKVNQGGGGGGGSSSQQGINKQRTYFLNVAHGIVPSAPSVNNYNSSPQDNFTNGQDVWTFTNTNPTNEQDTYAIWVWFQDNTPVNIDGPIKIFDGAVNSSNGEDGEEIEWIYRRVNTIPTNATLNTWESILSNCKGDVAAKDDKTFRNADAVPFDWNDNPSGVTFNEKYEYASFRRSSLNSNGKRIWGETGFCRPFIWSTYGEKGMDGDGIEYIFWGKAEAVTDWNTFSQNSQNLVNYPPSWTNNEGFQDNEYFGPNGSLWTDDPLGINDTTRRYIYMSKRKKVQNPQTGVSSWEPFSIPVLWNQYTGTSFMSNIFKRSPTKPNKPGANEGSFLNPVPSGWSDGIPAGTDSIWITSRIFSSNGQYPQQGEWNNVQLMSDTESFDVEFSPIESNPGTPTTNPNNWYDPTTDTNANWTEMIWMATRTKSNGAWGNWNITKIKGEQGEQGKDGTYIEYVYTRNNTGVAPAAPATTQTDDWHGTSGGVTWTDNPQGVEKNMMYEFVSIRTKENDTWSAFSPPVLWSKWGKDGRDGDGVEYIYYANTTGSIPPGQYPHEWEANQTPEFKGPDGSLWQDDPIDLSTLGQGSKQWVSVRKRTTTNGVASWGRFSEPALWSTYAKDGIVDGYTVDLTNENMPVGTSSSGSVSNYSNVCGVQVFHNGVEETNFKISTGTITRSDNVDPGNSITATPNNTNKTITVAISSASNFSAVNAYVPVTVTITTQSGTITRNLTISLFGIATGESGAAIDLFTSASAIRCDYERTTATPDKLYVGVKVSSPTNGVHKYDAGSTEAGNMHMTFGYFYNGNSNSIQAVSSSYISLSSKINGTNITDITVVMKYNEVIVDSETIPFVSDGAPGDYYAQQLSGVIMRIKSWDSISNSEMIEDGTTASSDGTTYLDVVGYNNSYYRIKTRTLKSRATVPEKADGSVNEDYWYMFAPSGDAAFNALIANSAFISNLTAKEVVITENNKPVAGLTSGTAQTGDVFTRGSVRIWAGNPIVNGTTNLTNCPFYVTNTGELHASNASISGNITATGGRFTGEFRVGDATSVNNKSGGFFKILPYREVPRSNGLSTILSGAIIGCDGTGHENLVISANGGNDSGSFGFTTGSHFDEDEIMLRVDSPDGGDNGKYYIVEVKNNVYKSGAVETTYYSYYQDPNESSNNPKSHVPSIFTIGINARGKVHIKSEVNGGGHAWETDADKIYYGDVYLDGDGYLRVKTWY